MAFRITQIHWEIIVSYMEIHPDLAKGFLNGPSGRDTSRRLWEELTLALNAAGLGERSTKKWQKTWTDFKHILKKKAAGIKTEINATGGGPPSLGPLSDIEKRILQILGPTFYEGLGRVENGCNFTMTSPPESSPTDNTVTNIEFEIVCTSTPKKKDSECPRDEVAIMTDAANSSSNEVLSLNQGQAKKSDVTPKRSCTLDHDYRKSPMKGGPKRVKKIREGSMEDMYVETLNELKDIKKCLCELTKCAQGIESAMKTIASYLIHPSTEG